MSETPLPAENLMYADLKATQERINRLQRMHDGLHIENAALQREHHSLKTLYGEQRSRLELEAVERLRLTKLLNAAGVLLQNATLVKSLVTGIAHDAKAICICHSQLMRQVKRTQTKQALATGKRPKTRLNAKKP